MAWPRGSTAGVVGIAHYMFQASVWFDDVCYLADLFVDETVRGQGAARGADRGGRRRRRARAAARATTG